MRKTSLRTQPTDWKPYVYEEDPVVEKAGKTIHWKEFTKEANVDCEIYPTLAKYGMLKEEMFDNKAFVGDIEAYGDLRASKDRELAIEKMWLSMPIKLRAQYGHNKNLFLDDLPNLHDKLLKEIKEKEQQEQPIIMEKENAE